MYSYFIVMLSMVVLNFQIGETNRIQVITDVIKSYTSSAHVNAFLCNQKDALELSKALFNIGTMIQIQNTNSIPIYNIFPAHLLVFVLDINCYGSVDLINCANSQNLFRSPFRWIILNDYAESYDNFLGLFAKINILVDSDLILMQSLNDTHYNLIQPYKIGEHSPIKIEHFAYWNENDGLFEIVENRVLANRRQNLEQIELKAVIVITNNETFNHLTDYKSPHIDSITKANYFVVKHAAEMMNVTLSYIVERTWGYYMKDSSKWSGLIGRLHRREADIAGTALFFTKDRIPIVQYLTMATPTKSKFVFRQPKLSFVTNVYQLPFQVNCWIATVFLVLITGTALYIATKWEDNYKQKLQNENTVYIDAGLKEIIFISFGAVCQQGAHALPSFLSGRLIAIILYLALMFLYTSYAANIVSLLQMPSTKIKTLGDLLHSRLDLGVHDTVFNRFYFPASTEPIRKAIYEQKVAPNGKPDKFMTMEEGVARMRSGLFAFHFEEGAGYKRIQETFFEHEKCGLKDLSYLQVPFPFLCVQKNLSYTEHWKIAYSKIQETGFNNREVNQIYTRKPRCESHGSGFISVGLVDCYPLAVILCLGIATSLLAFILETYVQLKSRKKLRMKISKWFGEKFKRV